MIEALRNAWRLPDVRNRLLITLLILLVYQFAAHVPVIGVDKNALQTLLDPTQSSAAGFIGVLNLLSGGAVANFSVLANGVYPYITASIIIQLLVPIVPRWREIQKEPGGQQKIQRFTYYLAVPMAILQSFSQIQIFTALGGGVQIIPGFGSDFMLTLAVIASMTAGTMFAVWLGELITEQGIGNGVSLIIFSGIVASAPSNFAAMITNSTDDGMRIWNVILFIILTLISIVAIVFIQEGVRRIPVQYGKRVRGRKQYGGATTHIPLKVNPVGMIPLIFSQAIIALPAVVVNFFPQSDLTASITQTFGNQQGFIYWASFFALTVAFTFFYSDVMVQNQDLANNLQRNGGFIPGIRPGKRTEEYIIKVTRRVTVVGALFLGLIAIVPYFVEIINSVLFPTSFVAGVAGNPATVLTGSGLIILVGVVIDTLRQLEAQLVMRHYEGFMR
ncbi:MAG TPA: preprotein translocase subunit SecY [Aggregatilineales bacterium]|jgi:preprotein translocase subunit SecY|nr:preprotein translocase subunit SecY [Aggregatilineales bacterium]